MPLRSRVDQRWIILMDESPMYLLSSSQETSNYDGLFNWTMTYRMNSDVPVPYGRTLKKESINFQYYPWISKPFWKTNMMSSKTKLLAVMISHCDSKNQRLKYVEALKSLLQDRLEIIGHCMNGNSTVCPYHFTKDCSVLSSYKFYLSFENSNCREYITEKVFWNAFHKYAVPIIMGAPLEDCQRLLPPSSYLHVDNFHNANMLVKYLHYLDRDNERYLKYHEWRDNYILLNEHGYFGSASKHYCRVCEALNYNPNTVKVYKKLDNFWNKDRDCISLL
ncbi:alpha-(1,3)-fucosyltransferase 5-like [Harpegnathos saltator]|nr:alpha-(1,3)-fucosyltransferase 5-like [Harpegnathos saltator]